MTASTSSRDVIVIVVIQVQVLAESPTDKLIKGDLHKLFYEGSLEGHGITYKTTTVLVQALPLSLPVSDGDPLLNCWLHLWAHELLLADAVIIAGINAIKCLFLVF